MMMTPKGTLDSSNVTLAYDDLIVAYDDDDEREIICIGKVT